MAQQVFPQWSPVVKAHNEDQQEVYIPAAIIHAQTRDGKDELIVGAANMQFDPETGGYLPTHAGNPVEVRARALETLLQALGKEETLALVKAALDVLVSKDFATQTTLAAVLEKLADLATESTLDGVKSAVDALASTVDAGAQKVTLTGSNLALRQTIVTGAKTVTSTAAEVFAGASRLSGRHAMVITNTGNNTVYIGASTVSASNGFPVFPQDTIRIEFDPQSSVAVFAVSDGPNVGVRVVELA